MVQVTKSKYVSRLNVVVASALSMLALSASASAASPPLLAQFGELGSGAGQLANPRGVAASPVNGHIFVVESSNNRVSEFTPWGQFVEAWGWGVRDSAVEAQTCTAETGCVAGLEGEGPGQFRGPHGIDVDSSGDVYVFEQRNQRVQKFSPEGKFLLMFGGGVNKGPHHPGNVCTATHLTEGDSCGAGSAGTGPGEFFIDSTAAGTIGDYLAVGPDDTIYVADKGRIQKFAPDGSFKSQFALPEDSEGANPLNANPGALDVDPKTGNLYFAFRQGHGSASEFRSGIYKLSPVGGLLASPIDLQIPKTVAVDPDGNVFASHEGFVPSDVPGGATKGYPEEVVEYDPAGNSLIGLGEGFASPPPTQIGISIETSALGENAIGNLLVAYFDGGIFDAFVRIYGPPPVAFEDPPKAPPSIEDQFATSVDPDGAVVRAKVNPHFWADTSYYVEYGTAPCFEGDCAAQPAAPGSKLTSEVVGTSVTSGGVFLAGLQPATTYHYRFVAQSGGGGPVFGVGGKVGVDGTEGTFTTPSLSAPPPNPDPCPNAQFRTGAGAKLPDCRAYEMVSPVDKNGGDIAVSGNISSFPAEILQAAPTGERFTYSSSRSFGEPEGSPYSSQYLATRGAGGWVSEAISPPRRGPSLYDTLGLDAQFKGFTADLCRGFPRQDSDFPLAAGAVAGFPGLYRRESCAGGGYLALTPGEPLGVTPPTFQPELQGLSADGSCAVFRTVGRLTEDAATSSTYQVYESCDGALSLVSVLPNGTASKKNSSAGTGDFAVAGRTSTVSNAISADGSRVFWTESPSSIGQSSGPGKLFTWTKGVGSTQIVAGTAQFWTAADDGSKAIYSVGEELFEYDVGAEESHSIATGFKGVAGAGEDAARVYFVSTEKISGEGEAGKPNLYLYEVGKGVDFIATLASADLNGLSLVKPEPINHAASTTPDGGALAFMSKGRPTGYDNTDAESGETDLEVYLYRAEAEELRCVSCLPSGARPSGRRLTLPGSGEPWAAAQIPTAESQLSPPRVLSDDGERLFFESLVPLAQGDTNAMQDVYQWEAQGKGSCADPGGCTSLISSGQSPQDSSLVDASADGASVFFKTGAGLVGWDPGLIDVYVAREGGGFPPPPSPPPACVGEGCQHPSSAPDDATPASAAFVGPGNSKANPHKPRCAKAKHKARGKAGRCGKQRGSNRNSANRRVRR